ncbi:MAG: hypothetical protein JXR77_05815 [Lentisphaeria bacterium]|nr:hypothetical protein [Lentisphaeria bacterium]
MGPAANPSMLRPALREIAVRHGSFALAAVAAAAAAAAVTASLASLWAHDRETQRLIRTAEEELRATLDRYDRSLDQAVRRLGFNLVILPEGQDIGDFHGSDFAKATMPEAHADRLAAAGLLSVGQFVPVLRRKERWPEKGWTIMVHARGPARGHLPDGTEPLPDIPVPRGTVDLGFELHRGLHFAAGDALTFLGRTFAVRTCLPEQGTHADITLWMNLEEAQEVLGLQGRVSEIRALECQTAWNRLAQVRSDIAAVLPGVTVLESRSETIATAEARDGFRIEQQRMLEEVRLGRLRQRLARLRLALVLSALALVLAGGTSGVVALLNARERCGEIALWVALGASLRQVQALFLWRTLLASACGCLAGWLGAAFAWGLPGVWPAALWLLAAFAAAWGTALPGVVVSAAFSARQDPASVLKNEV